MGSLVVAGIVLSPASITLVTSMIVLTGMGGYYFVKRLSAGPQTEESGALMGNNGKPYGSSGNV